MKNKDRKFKFEFLLLNDNKVLTDQNVTSWKFTNKGIAPVYINNQLLLLPEALSGITDSFEENIGIGEKTAQGYNIVFGNSTPNERRLQVIMKIEVFDY